MNDFCNALSKIIEVGVKNEVYNISSEAELSELEMYYKIANILNKTTPQLNKNVVISVIYSHFKKNWDRRVK